MEWINPNDVIKARYNPRKIGEDKLDLLAESIEKIGFIIPIIVNYENKTIVAGHQRTTTARKLGVEKIPAFYIKNITLAMRLFSTRFIMVLKIYLKQMALFLE